MESDNFTNIVKWDAKVMSRKHFAAICSINTVPPVLLSLRLISLCDASTAPADASC